MLGTLILVVIISLTISFFCSLMEAALLAMPLSYARAIADQNVRSGKLLLRFKRDIGSPISAILILNTISHTIGAAVSGALVDKIYGEPALVWFSIIFTLLILYLSEIIPKQIGAVYFKPVSAMIARPLAWLIRLFYPLIMTTNWIASVIQRVSDEPSVSEQEILSLAKIGREEGVLDTLESSIVRNIILLDRVTVKQVFTPRSVVFKLEETVRLKDIRDEICEWNHTRIPLFSSSDPDGIIGYVNQRDLMREMLKGNMERTLSDLSRSIKTVPETMPLDRLFTNIAETREPIRVVVDEYGVFIGIVTMEDIIEEIVGKEIVDEYDIVSDLRAYARILYARRKR